MIKLKFSFIAAGLMAGLALQFAPLPCAAQTPPSLPAGVQDIVKLSKSGLGDDVVLAQIHNSGNSYALSVDQILYLKDQGLSQAVIKALIGSGAPAPAVAAPAPAPAPVVVATAPAPAVVAPAPVVAPPSAPPPVSLDAFQAQLAPFGTWSDVPGYGLCWRPAASMTDPFWRPYCDQGHWVYTAEGWFWQSDLPWGDIAFHYGRWYRDPVSWVWVPGYDWAPAWVCWRHVEGYCGWAPLPPAAEFRAGVGLWFGGRLAVDVNFGLAPETFIFAPYDRFWEHNLRSFLLPRERALFVFRRSAILNGYRFDHGRFVVEGLGRERMAVLTRHDIRIEAPIIRHEIRGREVEHRVIERDRHEADRHAVERHEAERHDDRKDKDRHDR